MTVAQLVKIAAAVSPVFGLAENAITTAPELLQKIEAVAADLRAAPLNADGSPVTFDQASAHLASAEGTLASQVKAIRDKRDQYKAENAAADAGGAAKT
jgi:hypothetical protein